MAAPWRKNEDDAMMDGERLKGEVMMMDKDYKEAGDGRTCVGTEESVHTVKTRKCSVRSALSRVHVVGQGGKDGETRAQRKLPKAD